MMTEFHTAIAPVPSENDALNKHMLKKHNEARKRALDCKIAGQPQAKSMPMLVSLWTNKFVTFCTFIFDSDYFLVSHGIHLFNLE